MASTAAARTRVSKPPVPSDSSNSGHVELVQADTALISLRASGHDYCSAVGEVIDNSIQANANNVKLRLFTDMRAIGSSSKKAEVVERLAVGDDGDGMHADVLHRALRLGYSSRYDERSGMGRFGVGAKLAGISVARRLELWSRQARRGPWLYTHIDLDEIKEGRMRYIPPPMPRELPTDCRGLVGDRGTLVVWSKTDRLAARETGGARQATTVETELMRYTARTFRKFLDSGIRISVGDRIVKPHDPLYLMASTRFHEGPHAEPCGTLVVDESFDWPVPRDPSKKAKVTVRITLLPEQFRQRRGEGGSDSAKERRIPENEGVSILRANREIFFGHLRGVQPTSEKQDRDRFWGCEIEFSPELDECFQVRNVKKGAEPTDALRDRLHEIVFKTVHTLRKQISAHWDMNAAAEERNEGVHWTAEKVALKTHERSAKPRAGQEVEAAERERRIRGAAEMLAKDQPHRQADVADEIRNRPFTLIPESWPGNELFEIEHLGSNALVHLNMRHPFYQEVYRPLLERLSIKQSPDASEEERALARLAQESLDLLIVAYARAEGMRSNATEHYSDLRTNWGLHLKTLVQEWKNL